MDAITRYKEYELRINIEEDEEGKFHPQASLQRATGGGIGKSLQSFPTKLGRFSSVAEANSAAQKYLENVINGEIPGLEV